ncbi:MAG: hypothetical protein ACRC1Z_04885, partial [Waterburya sp.]
ETAKRGELEIQSNDRAKLIEQLNRQLAEQEKNYEVLNLKGNEQQEEIENLRSQLAEKSSFAETISTSSTYKTWAIIFLGILLTVASAISAQSYL